MIKNKSYIRLDSQFIITAHAIEQYISRWSRNSSLKKAEQELQILFRCLRCKDKTLKGDQIMVSDYNPEIRFVFKDKYVCVTVLPKRDSEENDLTEESIDSVRDYLTYNNDLLSNNNKQLSALNDEINSVSQQIALLRDKLNKLKNEKFSLENHRKELQEMQEILSLVKPQAEQ